MSSALKQVIVNAIVKVAGHNPVRDIPGEPTAEQARDEFIQLLIAELFPENPSVPAIKEKKKPGPKPKLDENGNPIRKAKSPKSVVSPDSLGASSPVKEKKKPGPKPKLDENGEPIKKVKKAKTEAPASPASTASKEKKPRAPMSEEAKAAMVAKRKATMEAKKADAPATPEKETPPLPASPPKAPKKAKKAAEPEASPKKSPKKAKAAEPKPSPKKAKKPSAETTANLDKFTATQKKWLAEVAGDKEVEKKDVLSYLNGLSNAAFNDKPLKDHFRDYIASLAPVEEPETQKQEMNLIEQEFDGETYGVDPETKRVYTVDENGNATPVGYVGMAKFEAMELEEDDE